MMKWNEEELIKKARFELTWAAKMVDTEKASRIRFYGEAHSIIEALWTASLYLEASKECQSNLQALVDVSMHQMCRK